MYNSGLLPHCQYDTVYQSIQYSCQAVEKVEDVITIYIVQYPALDNGMIFGMYNKHMKHMIYKVL